MRPCTNETKAFCEAIESKNRPSAKELRAMIDKCSLKHNQMTKEAAMGQGFDRHLFALKTAAERIRILENFDLFKDPAYANINQNIISTSTLTSNGLLAGGERQFLLNFLAINNFEPFKALDLSLKTATVSVTISKKSNSDVSFPTTRTRRMAKNLSIACGNLMTI